MMPRVIHTVCLGLWAGGAVTFSFLAAPRIFSYLHGELPTNPPAGVSGISDEVGRELAGNVVARIFPWYFASQIACGVFATGAGIALARRGGRLDRVRAALVAAALLIVAAHAATVYPKSVVVLKEHYAARDRGDANAAQSLRASFGMWHGISQTLNVTTIALVVVALGLAGVMPPSPRVSGEP